MRKTVGIAAAAMLMVALVGVGSASAGAVITSGPVSMGINNEGDLNFGGVGLRLTGVGDGIIPGCPCEGWGVAGNGVSGDANRNFGGAHNLTLVSFGSTASTATSVVDINGVGLRVTQAYAPSAGAPTELFEDVVTITNTSGATITDIRYRRVMDWDIPTTPFTEAVTVGGAPASALLYVGDDGFASANPLASRGIDIGGCGTGAAARFVDCAPSRDHGAIFDFGFGDLEAGKSITFSIFYGATFSERTAFAALAAVGAELYSFGQHDGGFVDGVPGTFIWGFKGVGGTPVPEPATMMLLGLGLVGLAGRFRR